MSLTKWFIKMIIEYHQRRKFYTATDDTVLAEQTQDIHKDAKQTPSQDNQTPIEETQL